MAFDGLFMRGLVLKLSELLTGGRIDKIHQPENDEVQLTIRAEKSNYKLKISADAALPHVTLWDDKKENPLAPPLFCMLMRKHLLNGKILDIRQQGLERVLEFDVESRDELGTLSVKTLIVEIMGKHSNIILVQKEDGRILESIKRISASMSRVRPIYPGIVYTQPPFDKKNLLEGDWTSLETLPSLEETVTLPKWLVGHFQGFSPMTAKILLRDWDLPEDCSVNALTPAERRQLLKGLETFKGQLDRGTFRYGVLFEEGTRRLPVDLFAFAPLAVERPQSLMSFDSPIEAVNAFFTSKDQGNRLDQKAAFMKKTVQSKLERAYVKLNKLHEDMTAADQLEIFKIKGELLLANMYQLEKGLSNIVLDNYYADPPEPLEIALDIRLTPVDNAQRYFKRYNKAKTGQIEILKQLEETESDIAYLENVMTLIEQTTEPDNLDEIRNELAGQGYIKRKATSKHKKVTFSPLQYRSSEGFEILVGKNNLQNDQLTLKVASNKDLWLHTKVIPGSHVIIRTQGQEVPEQTLLEAAMIAAWHSKGRLSGQVPVDYTHVKNVSKPAGAKPGMVIYSTNKTLYVTPSEKDILALAAK